MSDEAVPSIASARENVVPFPAREESRPAASGSLDDLPENYGGSGEPPGSTPLSDDLDSELSGLPANDTGNAQRLMRRYGERFRFVREVGPFVWTGSHWDGAGGGELGQRVIGQSEGDVYGGGELHVQRDGDESGQWGGDGERDGGGGSGIWQWGGIDRGESGSGSGGTGANAAVHGQGV